MNLGLILTFRGFVAVISSGGKFDLDWERHCWKEALKVLWTKRTHMVFNEILDSCQEALSLFAKTITGKNSVGESACETKDRSLNLVLLRLDCRSNVGHRTFDMTKSSFVDFDLELFQRAT